MDALSTLRDGLCARKMDLLRAISDDFGGRCHEETLMLEVFALLSQIRHARSHLKGWMRQRAVSSAWYFQPSRVFYQYQPVGVVGVVGAWNCPLLLSLGPMIDALAAGNHVMLKTSEMAPRSASVICALIGELFPPDYVTCVQGDADIASSFCALPFDHLFFTGSTATGRLVMQAAAPNLTPVTLELGGKSPAIVHASYPLDLAVKRIMVGKLYNAGQTCVAPDYVLIPEGREAVFEQAARREVAALYPALASTPDYTRIINDRHLARLSAAVEDATAQGARVISLGQIKSSDKMFPPTLIFGATDRMTVMREEIFGPLLPVLTYRSIDDAIEFVNARPRPLALYYFDNNRRRLNEVLGRTLSGGVTVNDCIFHLGQPNLPFGGVGNSGMGHYHGFDGFVTFSKKRGVMVQRRWAATALLHAPFGRWTRRLISLLLKIEGRRVL